MIGPIHLLNQSDARLKHVEPITTWSRAFSRAWRQLRVLASCSHWFIVLFYSAVIGHSDSFLLRFFHALQLPACIQNLTIIVRAMAFTIC